MVDLSGRSLRYTPRIVPSVHRLTRRRSTRRLDDGGDDVVGFAQELQPLDDSGVTQHSPEQQPLLAKAS